MLVKCRICQQLIEKDIAFCMRNGKSNYYYCSEQEYNDYKMAQQIRSENIEIITTYYGYFLNMTTPYGITQTLLKDEKLKNIPLEKIAHFMVEKKEKIKNIIEQKQISGGNFKSPYYCGKYINAIIYKWIVEKAWEDSQENLNISKIIKQYVDMEFYETKYEDKPKTRRPLNELEELL